MQFFQSQQQSREQYSQLSDRRLQAEDIIDASALMYEEDENDPDQIIFKSTTAAKYITIDMILEKEYKINEAQLKRMLYQADFEQLIPH
jgi:homogentisate 1,2-dioxygenase